MDERKRLVGSGFGSFRVVRALHRPFAVSYTHLDVYKRQGLEYDNVFIIDLIDGEFPQKSILNSFDEKLLEEERRLFYVAMTRARKRLFLYTIKERNNLPVEPSIFYNELKNKTPTLS